MSSWFDRIKKFYNSYDLDGNKLWDINRVRRAVECGAISEEEYKLITDEEYPA